MIQRRIAAIATPPAATVALTSPPRRLPIRLLIRRLISLLILVVAVAYLPSLFNGTAVRQTVSTRLAASRDRPNLLAEFRRIQLSRPGDNATPAVKECFDAAVPPERKKKTLRVGPPPRNRHAPPRRGRRLKDFTGAKVAPVVNLSFPKTGTTSLWKFFKCGGVAASHFDCVLSGSSRTVPCGLCINGNVRSSRSPFDGCGDYHVWVQTDYAREGIYPQLDAGTMQAVHDHHPDATFLYGVRPFDAWIKSVDGWAPPPNVFALRDLMRCHDLEGLPTGVGGTLEEMRNFYEGHLESVREFVRAHPTHRLVEVQIDSDFAGEVLEEAFGILRKCWGQYNKIREFP
eukprot:CAMPEP_0194277106 /NCGR_PEP_ID=MMETSP0169-20130528/9514_1 /TAXON_ID=218684 /ORGANISM="Corethron pennatum, Strain L29A3" /LENGTH=343 /DNA_ID=CAMNT_0039020981 /DNA_START=110 /DNA_END=1141 /DNA_ORIENTATION=-